MRIVLGLFSLLLLTACYKAPLYSDACEGNCLIFEGLVIDEASGEPIRAHVSLVNRRGGTMLSTGSADVVAQTETDQYGHYRLSTNYAGSESLRVEVDTDLYLKNGCEPWSSRGYFQPSEINTVFRDTFALMPGAVIDWSFYAQYPGLYRDVTFFITTNVHSRSFGSHSDVGAPFQETGQLVVTEAQEVIFGYHFERFSGSRDTIRERIPAIIGETRQYELRMD